MESCRSEHCGGFRVDSSGSSIFPSGCFQLRGHLAVRRFSGAEWSFAGVSLLVIGLKIAVGAGFLVTYGFQIYLLGLVWLILNCVIGFYGFMARSLWGN